MRTILLFLIIGFLTIPNTSISQSVNKPTDQLNLSAGAVVLSSSSEYDKGRWSALSLVDSTAKTGWCSAQEAPFPHELVTELPQTVGLTKLVVDNTNAQEKSHPGISAKQIDFFVSTTSPKDGFTKALSGEAKQGARTEFALPQGTPARWLKLKINSNWGHPQYTEVMELEGYGSPMGKKPQQPPVAGAYQTNYNMMLFQQDGTTVTGCYDWHQGIVSGSTDGRVVRFEWRQKQGKEIGTAVMVLASDGQKLNGLWYYKGILKGVWDGTRAPAGKGPKCQIRGKTAMSQSLQESGRAIVYGIRFDYNSDKIQPESETILNQILTLLKGQGDLKLKIAGFTSSEGSADYNQQLSQRRAQAVVNWLIAKGIAGDRLQAQGFGEQQPVADNSTEQGKVLNRRVEVMKI